MTPTQTKVVKLAEAIILKQSDVMKAKEMPAEALPMNVTELRQAVIDMWESEIVDKE